MTRQRNGRQRHAAGLHLAQTLEGQLTILSNLSKADLRKAWADRIGSEPPKVRSAELLRRLLAWQLQASAFGGFDAATERKLRDIAMALERDGDYEPKVRRGLTPGVELAREWKGTVYKVTVVADGFQHLGKRYKSLSNIARTITGTRWSGPRFFGLEQKTARGSRGGAQ